MYGSNAYSLASDKGPTNRQAPISYPPVWNEEQILGDMGAALASYIEECCFRDIPEDRQPAFSEFIDEHEDLLNVIARKWYEMMDKS